MSDRKRRKEYIAIMGGERIENVTNGNGTCFEREFKYTSDPVHMDIANYALTQLTEPEGIGYFSKEDAIEAIKAANPYVAGILDAAVETNNIHWDYIVRYLNEQYGADLIPLAANFFKGRNALKDQMKAAQKEFEETGNSTGLLSISGRAIASGYGKKTAGWAAVRHDTTGLSIMRVKRKAAVAKGVVKSYDRAVLEAGEKGVALPQVEEVRSVSSPAPTFVKLTDQSED